MITLRGVNEPECGSETRTTTATGGAGRLRASDTLSVIENFPAAVGVPERMPAELRLKPSVSSGVQTNGARPPVTMN